MSAGYDYKALKERYSEVAHKCKTFPEVDAEYKKACAELEKLVPDAKMQTEIRDCFGQCLDKYQMQGFINGFVYSSQTFFEECKREIPEDKTQMTPNQRIMKCEKLTYGSSETKNLCSKLHLIYNDMFDELQTSYPRIEELLLRLDMMSDYISRLMDNSDKVSELAEVVYQSVGGTYVE